MTDSRENLAHVPESETSGARRSVWSRPIAWYLSRLRNSRRSRIRLTLLIAVIALGVWGGRKYLKKRAVQPTDAPVEYAAVPRNPALPLLPAGISLDYDVVSDVVGSHFRSPLDIEPKEWEPAKYKFKAPAKPLDFSVQQMPAPTAEEIAQWKKETPLVRWMPYPYYRSMSIPWDPENSIDVDIFYNHMLMSRRYGLDFPTAFFPYDPTPSAHFFTIFNGSQDAPRVYATRFPGKNDNVVDAFPFFLTAYYRGWTDHIHGWSSEACYPHSIFEAEALKLEADGAQSRGLILAKDVFDHRWRGFEVALEVSEGVESVELEIVESAGKVKHVLAWGSRLGERAGWELSLPEPGQNTVQSVHLSEEKQRGWGSTLGRTSAPGFLEQAQLRVVGKRRAFVQLRSVKLFDPDRRTIERQLASMKQWNILPAVATAHGGYSGWALMGHNGIDNYNLKFGDRTSLRKALGSVPNTPAYCSDLLIDSGLIFMNRLGKTGRNAKDYLTREEFADGRPYYESVRSWSDQKSDVSFATDNHELAENAGSLAAAMLMEKSGYGKLDVVYTHNSVFTSSLIEKFPLDQNLAYMRDVKTFHPYTEQAFEALSDCKYDFEGTHQSHQRVWSCPVSAASRFALGLRHLRSSAQIQDNVVEIARVQDPVTKTTFPDPKFLTQDLHGQTFYVKDAKTARVKCGEIEIRSLRRNPPDFTGRESVTVADVTTPTKIFDEIDLFEVNGRIEQKNANAFLRQGDAYRGKHALEVQCKADGDSELAWFPVAFDNHETEALRFAYKKTNPNSEVFLGWSKDSARMQIVAAEGELGGLQGWRVHPRRDGAWHEVVLDFSDMEMPAKGKKVLPRSRIKGFYFGIRNAKKGDSAFFDCAEFLAARGVRPHSGKGLVVGGRVTPPEDGRLVILEDQTGRRRETLTCRGGWYLFQDIPPDTVAAVTYSRQGVEYYPIAGRVFEVCKNDVGHHIYAVDPKSNSLPRPHFGRKCGDSDFHNCAIAAGAEKEPWASRFVPHSHMTYIGPAPGADVEFVTKDQANNFGFLDKDRRIENKDNAIRIALVGDCLLENVQTERCHHLNVFLESFLRRRLGVNVEVLSVASSNASAGSNVPAYEKYAHLFKPDLTLVFSYSANMANLEPTLQELRWGWAREHSPYGTFDFDDNGRLIRHPADENYGAFMLKVESQPKLEGVALDQSFYSTKPFPRVTRRSFQMLKGVLAEHYRPLAAKHDGKVMMVTGHAPTVYPPYGSEFSRERWGAALKEISEEAGVPLVDLAVPLAKLGGATNAFQYVNDGHNTVTANYTLAKAMMEVLIESEAFQEIVRRQRSMQKTSDATNRN